MALQLGRGGAQRAAQAMRGAAISSQPLYASFYFNSGPGPGHVTTPMSSFASLHDMRLSEIQTPGTNGYVRVQVDDKLGTPTYNTSGMYWETTNAAPITAFTSSGPLAQTLEWSVSLIKIITFIVISNQPTDNTTSLDHIHAFGPLGYPIFPFDTSDALVIPAGQLSLRQS